MSRLLEGLKAIFRQAVVVFLPVVRELMGIDGCSFLGILVRTYCTVLYGDRSVVSDDNAIPEGWLCG